MLPLKLPDLSQLVAFEEKGSLANQRAWPLKAAERNSSIAAKPFLFPRFFLSAQKREMVTSGVVILVTQIAKPLGALFRHLYFTFPVHS